MTRFWTSLYTRGFLILFLPMVLVIGVLLYTFVDRNLDKTLSVISQSMAREVRLLSAVLKDPKLEKDLGPNFFTTYPLTYSIRSGLLEEMSSRGNLPIQNRWADERLQKSLDEALHVPFLLTSDEEHITIWAQITPTQVLEVQYLHKHLFSRTVPIVLFGTIGASLFCTLIAFLFLRNQVRPIDRLSEAMDQFGRGEFLDSYAPSGSWEVRRAGKAFLTMADRIKRFLSQRTDMLAGVSHDLKTPLTRLKLQLSLLPKDQAETRLSMDRDIDHMQQVLSEYLAFVRAEGEEAPKSFSLHALIQEELDRINPTLKKNQHVILSGDNVVLTARPQAITRCLGNILQNALRFGHHIKIHTAEEDGQVSIHIEDDGPGIDPSLRSEVFKPFFRLDAPGLSDDGLGGRMGLGLTIARDIARAHGGDVIIQDSQKGCHVQITL